jgi:hypothetical protein
MYSGTRKSKIQGAHFFIAAGIRQNHFILTCLVIKEQWCIGFDNVHIHSKVSEQEIKAVASLPDFPLPSQQEHLEKAPETAQWHLPQRWRKWRKMRTTVDKV